MPLMRGEDVLEQAQQFAPRTLLAIQVDRASRAKDLTAMGADAALSRQRTAVDVAADIAALITAHSAFVDP